MKTARVLVLLACAVAWITAAAAMNLYRYKNEQGIPVISHYIPPELVHNGYEVIDEQGRVVEAVPRELTPAELEEKHKTDEAKKLAEEAVLTRKRKDAELLEIYSSVEDVESARDRKLKLIDADIGRIKAQMEQATIQKAKLEAQAADRERAGQSPSTDLLDNIARVQMRIEGHGRDVETRELEKQKERRNFDYDVARMSCLLGLSTPEACRDPQTAAMKTPAASSGH